MHITHHIDPHGHTLGRHRPAAQARAPLASGILVTAGGPHLLDLTVAPDRSRWQWKDEDEYDQGRRLGLISDAEHRRVELARERAVAMVEAGGGPFAQELATRCPQAAAPLPVLPPDALTVPCPRG
jgi:hypothetical protein